MRYTIVLRGLSFFLCLYSAGALADCIVEQPYRPDDDVLIIANANSIDSEAVACHYAQRRRINPANIVTVNSPAAYFVSWDNFVVLRDQIIYHMQQPSRLKPGAPAAPACTGGAGNTTSYYCAASMDHLRQYTRIRYVVTTKGLPTTIQDVPGSLLHYADLNSLDEGPTSVDNYLRFWLINYFPPGSGGTNPQGDYSFGDINVLPAQGRRESEFGDGRGFRTVLPQTDRELIIGRIDGLDRAHAEALVDRAIEAEQSGVFGKLYGDRALIANYPSVAMKNFATGQQLYTGAGQWPEVAQPWRFQLGPFGELTENGVTVGERHNSIPQCYSNALEPLIEGDTDPDDNGISGLIPAGCVARTTSSGTLNFADPDAGTTGTGPSGPAHNHRSRTQVVDSPLIYFDGRGIAAPVSGSWYGLLHWMNNRQCIDEELDGDSIAPVLMCDDFATSAERAACREASTDFYKEINTQCVGVADGFVGSLVVSYPMSYLSSWPTNWQSPGSGESQHLWFPVMRDSGAADGTHSVWFGNTEQKANPACYASSDFSAPANGACPDRRHIRMRNGNGGLNVPVQAGQQYTVRACYKAEDLDTDVNLRFRFVLNDANSSTPEVYYPGPGSSQYANLATVSCPSGNCGTEWVCAENTQIVESSSPTLASIYSVEFLLESNGGTNDIFGGRLGLDNISLTVTPAGGIPGSNLLTNGSFENGFKQTTGNEFGAAFLSRLNGTAWWGSMTHHESGGHSFENHQLETMTYFLRGLPLGDAVWFAERHNSGVLYGDPLYSPIAVQLHRFEDTGDIYDSKRAIIADAVNGTGSSVASTYTIDYCAGSDFFVCDQQGTWTSASLVDSGDNPIVQPAQTTKLRNQSLGGWDTTGTGLAWGLYTLRLGVRSTNAANQKSQTFYDYYTVRTADSNVDSDGDGLDDLTEGAGALSDPYNPDSDDDRVVDGIDPNPVSHVDTDGDGMSDDWENLKQLNAASSADGAPNSDADGDGVSNYLEYFRSTDPKNILEYPDFVQLLVDNSNAECSDTAARMNDAIYCSIQAGIAHALGGDTVSIRSGLGANTYSFVDGWYNGPLLINKPIILRADQAALIQPANLSNVTISGVSWGRLEGFRFIPAPGQSNGLPITIDPSVRYFRLWRIYARNAPLKVAGKYVTIRSSVVTQVNTDVAQNAVEIASTADSTTLNHVTIADNELLSPVDGDFKRANALFVDSPASRPIIRNSIVWQTGGGGILGVLPTDLSNSIVSDSSLAGTTVTTSDPMFVNVTGANVNGRNLAPQLSSPAMNAAVVTGITADLNGFPLSAQPDIGAYQLSWAGRWSFEEDAASTTAANSAELTSDASAMNSPVNVAAGAVGWGRTLNGTNQGYSVTDPGNGSFNFVNGLTVTVWVRGNGNLMTGSSGYGPAAIAGIDDQFNLSIRETGGNVQLNLKGANGVEYKCRATDAESAKLTDTKWHQLAATYGVGANGRFVKIYIDGVPAVVKSWTNTDCTGSGIPLPLNSATGPFVIGTPVGPNLGGPPLASFADSLDEVRLYARALTDNEISGIYAQESGPRLHWSLDESTVVHGSLDRFSDAGTYGLDGLISGSLRAPAQTLDDSRPVVGEARWFDGDDQVSTVTNDNLDVTNAFTLMAWVQGRYDPLIDETPQQRPGNYRFLVGNYVGTNILGKSDAYNLSFRETGGELQLHVVPDPATGLTNPVKCKVTGSSGLITDTNWHHVAGVFDGASQTMRLYVDGIEKRVCGISDGVPSRVVASDGDFRVGGSVAPNVGGPPLQYFADNMDDPRLYARAMEATAIKKIFMDGIPLLTAQASAVGHWSLDDDTSSTSAIIDSSDYSERPAPFNVAHDGVATASRPSVVSNGHSGSALAFNGAGQGINFADDGTFTVADQLSLSAWVRALDGSFMVGNAAGTAIAGKADMFAFGFRETGENLLLALRGDDGTAYRCLFPVIANPTSWHHVAATYDGQGRVVRLYVDGNRQGLQCSGTTNVPALLRANANNFSIGLGMDLNPGGPPLQNFADQIDDLQIFNRVLTDSEVYDLAQQ